MKKFYFSLCIQVYDIIAIIGFILSINVIGNIDDFVIRIPYLLVPLIIIEAILIIYLKKFDNNKKNKYIYPIIYHSSDEREASIMKDVASMMFVYSLQLITALLIVLIISFTVAIAIFNVNLNLYAIKLFISALILILLAPYIIYTGIVIYKIKH